MEVTHATTDEGPTARRNPAGSDHRSTDRDAAVPVSGWDQEGDIEWMDERMRFPPLDEPHASDGLILLLGVLAAIALAVAGLLLFGQSFVDPVDPGVPASVPYDYYED